MKIIAFVVSLALFVGGLWIMGESFSVVGAESVVFMAGILACTLGIAIPVHVLKRLDA